MSNQGQRNANNNGNGSNTIALLSLPCNASISLDGSESKKVLKAGGEDLIVVRHVPYGFHLLTTTMSEDDNKRRSAGASGVMHSVGLLMLFDGNGNGMSDSGSDGCCFHFVAKRFDRRTEELSPEPLDEMTKNNLTMAIGNNTVDLSRVIPYGQFVSSSSMSTNHQNQTGTRSDGDDNGNAWRSRLTNFISKQVLRGHHLTGQGDKIIPGSYTCEEDRGGDGILMHDKEYDGMTLQYPPIPCLQVHNYTNGHDQRDRQKRTHIDQGLVHHHIGTRRFLAKLEPNQRTALFMNVSSTATRTNADDFQKNPSLSPPDTVFLDIIHRYYHNQWELLLGDLQLSFTVFVCCSCLSSLEHWRDAIYMLSLVSPTTISSHEHAIMLYYHLLIILNTQLSNFDCDIFHDDDYAEGNVFIPAILRICQQCKSVSQGMNSEISVLEIHQKANDLLSVIIERFDLPEEREEMETSSPKLVQEKQRQNICNGNEKEASMYLGLDSHVICNNNMNFNDSGTTKDVSHRRGTHMSSDDDDECDDEDGPVLVPYEEVQACMDRSSQIQNFYGNSPISMKGANKKNQSSTSYDLKEKYPFLFAATVATRCNEDIIMACARILDEQSDVTLVREAAAYLEEVEANRQYEE